MNQNSSVPSLMDLAIGFRILQRFAQNYNNQFSRERDNNSNYYLHNSAWETPYPPEEYARPQHTREHQRILNPELPYSSRHPPRRSSPEGLRHCRSGATHYREESTHRFRQSPKEAYVKKSEIYTDPREAGYFDRASRHQNLRLSVRNSPQRDFEIERNRRRIGIRPIPIRTSCYTASLVRNNKRIEYRKSKRSSINVIADKSTPPVESCANTSNISIVSMDLGTDDEEKEISRDQDSIGNSQTKENPKEKQNKSNTINNILQDSDDFAIKNKNDSKMCKNSVVAIDDSSKKKDSFSSDIEDTKNSPNNSRKLEKKQTDEATIKKTVHPEQTEINKNTRNIIPQRDNYCNKMTRISSDKKGSPKSTFSHHYKYHPHKRRISDWNKSISKKETTDTTGNGCIGIRKNFRLYTPKPPSPDSWAAIQNSTRNENNVETYNPKKLCTIPNRDPRLRKNAETVSNGPAMVIKSVDPRTNHKAYKKWKVHPIELEVPHFSSKSEATKETITRDTEDRRPIRKPTVGRIRKRSSVCEDNIDTIRRFCTIPLEDLEKFCCHVNIYKDECKNNILRESKDISISLIDTKKSYLPANKPEKKDLHVDERKQEDGETCCSSESEEFGGSSLVGISWINTKRSYISEMNSEKMNPHPKTDQSEKNESKISTRNDNSDSNKIINLPVKSDEVTGKPHSSKDSIAKNNPSINDDKELNNKEETCSSEQTIQIKQTDKHNITLQGRKKHVRHFPSVDQRESCFNSDYKSVQSQEKVQSSYVVGERIEQKDINPKNNGEIMKERGKVTRNSSKKGKYSHKKDNLKNSNKLSESSSYKYEHQSKVPVESVNQSNPTLKRYLPVLPNHSKRRKLSINSEKQCSNEIPAAVIKETSKVGSSSGNESNKKIARSTDTVVNKNSPQVDPKTCTPSKMTEQNKDDGNLKRRSETTSSELKLSAQVPCNIQNDKCPAAARVSDMVFSSDISRDSKSNHEVNKDSKIFENPKTSSTCVDKSEEDMIVSYLIGGVEYSLHIPEGSESNATADSEMSPDELLRTLEESIEGMASPERSISTVVLDESSQNDSSESLNFPTADFATSSVVDVNIDVPSDILSEKSVTNEKVDENSDNSEDVQTQPEVDTGGIENMELSYDSEKNTISGPSNILPKINFSVENRNGNSEDGMHMIDDEDLLLHVKVIENPEVKIEQDINLGMNLKVNLYNLQHEIKTEDPYEQHGSSEIQPNVSDSSGKLISPNERNLLGKLNATTEENGLSQPLGKAVIRKWTPPSHEHESSVVAVNKSDLSRSVIVPNEKRLEEKINAVTETNCSSTPLKTLHIRPLAPPSHDQESSLLALKVSDSLYKPSVPNCRRFEEKINASNEANGSSEPLGKTRIQHFTPASQESSSTAVNVSDSSRKSNVPNGERMGEELIATNQINGSSQLKQITPIQQLATASQEQESNVTAVNKPDCSKKFGVLSEGIMEEELTAANQMNSSSQLPERTLIQKLAPASREQESSSTVVKVSDLPNQINVPNEERTSVKFNASFQTNGSSIILGKTFIQEMTPSNLKTSKPNGTYTQTFTDVGGGEHSNNLQLVAEKFTKEFSSSNENQKNDSIHCSLQSSKEVIVFRSSETTINISNPINILKPVNNASKPTKVATPPTSCNKNSITLQNLLSGTAPTSSKNSKQNGEKTTASCVNSYVESSKTSRAKDSTSVKRQMPRLSNIVNRTTVYNALDSAKRGAHYASNVFQIVNAYMITKLRARYLIQSLGLLSNIRSLEVDVANVSDTISKVKEILAEVLVHNVPNFDVKDFAHFFMEYLILSVKDENLKTFFSFYLWELIFLRINYFDQSATLKYFKTYIENDLKIQKNLSALSMTRTQYTMLKTQIYGYLHSLGKPTFNIPQENNETCSTNTQNATKVQYVGRQDITDKTCYTQLQTRNPMETSASPNNKEPPKSPASTSASVAVQQYISDVQKYYLQQPRIQENAINMSNNAPAIAQQPRPICFQKKNSQKNSKKGNIMTTKPSIVQKPGNGNRKRSYEDTAASTTFQLNRPDSSHLQPPLYSETYYAPQKKHNYSTPYYTPVTSCSFGNVNQGIMCENPSYCVPGQSLNSVNTTNQIFYSTSYPITSSRMMTNNSSNQMFGNDFDRYIRPPENRMSSTTMVTNNVLQKTFVDGFYRSIMSSGTSTPIASSSLTQKNHPNQQFGRTFNMNIVPQTERLPNMNIFSNQMTVDENSATRSTMLKIATNPTHKQNPIPPILNTSNKTGEGILPNQNYTGESNMTLGVSTLAPKKATNDTQTERNIFVASNNGKQPVVSIPSSLLTPNTPPNPFETSKSGKDFSEFINQKECSSVISQREPLPYPTPPISNENACSGNLEEFSLGETTGTPSDQIKQLDVKPRIELSAISKIEDFIFNTSVHLKDETEECVDLTWSDDDEVKMEPSKAGYELTLDEPEDSLLFLNNRKCICGTNAIYVCACNAAMYCSQECQFKDWENHQSNCPSGISP